MKEDKFPIFIAYDIEEKRAGCAIIQAMFGGTISSFELMGFNNWLTHPTKNMKRYVINTKEDLKLIQNLTNHIHKSF